MNRPLLLLLLAVTPPFISSARDPGSATAGAGSEAYDTVKTAGRFTVGGVGYAGSPSRQERAFRQLLKQPEPLVRCQKLLSEATPAGQLYGLLGIRILDQQAFQAALPRYINSKLDIPTMGGCVVMHTTAAKLAKQVEKGQLK